MCDKSISTLLFTIAKESKIPRSKLFSKQISLLYRKNINKPK